MILGPVQDVTQPYINEGYERDPPLWQENYIENYKQQGKGTSHTNNPRYSQYYPGRSNSEKLVDKTVDARDTLYRSVADSK